MRSSRSVIAMVLALVCSQAPGQVRIKDIVDIKGVRSNPLWAYGLVIGLNGTGDNSPASKQAMTNLLRRNGLVLDPDQLASKNIASVIVTAELPPFAAAGSRIDVTVSAIGNTSSLQGGTLLMTPLMGADGQVYAVAQGPLSLGGFAAGGEKATVSVNHNTVGRISEGATIEREEPTIFVENNMLTLVLRNSDFSTAQGVAESINRKHQDSAIALDASTVRVCLPTRMSRRDLSSFVDGITKMEVQVDQPAMVVINERTGTIIVGEKVTISSVAICHGNLSIITEEKDFASQPPPFNRGGTTERLQRTQIQAREDAAELVLIPQVSVAELAQVLNAMGMTPRDLIAIFQALRQAGALQATLKII